MFVVVQINPVLWSFNFGFCTFIWYLFVVVVAGKFSDGQYESLPSAQSYQTLVSVYKLALSLVSSKTEIWARFSQLGNAEKLFNVLLSSQRHTSLKVQFRASTSWFSCCCFTIVKFSEFFAFRVFQAF